MAVENGPAGGLAENDDVRRRALLRLGMAGVVTAAALAGLWWLDQSGGGKPEKSAPTALPSPIVSAPMQASAPPLTTPETAATQVETPEETAAEPADEPTTRVVPSAMTPARALAGGEAPPPPRVNNQPPRAAPAAAHVPTQISAAAPTTTPRATSPATALGEPYLVQLGVFSDPTRARELVDRLNKQGIRAHMETRVHLGPFANREEAEKAQVTMRKLGLKGVLTPAATK